MELGLALEQGKKLCKFHSDGIEILSTAEHSRSAKNRDELRMKMGAPQPHWSVAAPSPTPRLACRVVDGL